MNRIITALVLTLLPALLLAGPRYASEETREVIEAMIEAHGGMETWANAPAIRFDNVMHDNFASKQSFAWWVTHEVIDQKTRRVYQEWPMDDAQTGYDGERAWGLNYKRGNPPAFGVHVFYYFVNLPWLTQDDNVVLSEPGSFVWPGTDKALIEVTMNFSEAPAIGKTEKDYFVLYIDPDSHRLVGYQYAIGYRPMLDVMGQPPERELFGPLWRLITRYEEVDGLIFPSAFRTMPEADERIVGNHVILNIDISTPFDAEKANKPPKGVYDAP